jgi:hypothetical protein
VRSRLTHSDGNARKRRLGTSEKSPSKPKGGG